MAALQLAGQKRKIRVEYLKAPMDALPVEVIGLILSHLGYACYVARASATCRKWREAAKHHLQKLAFEGFPYPNRRTSSEWEILITESVMRTSCLSELVVRVDPISKFRFHAAAVIEWLQHTKKTLRSFTFEHPIEPRINILEKLGGITDSKLEQLWWGSGYITAIDPTIHRFDSLVSLTLFCMENALAASNLESILSACPKLESLVFVSLEISGEGNARAHPTLEITSSSLKSLFINQGFGAITRLILHTNSLECLSLQDVMFQLVKLVDGDGHSSLQRLSIVKASIAKLEIGESASLLHKLRLNQLKDFEAEWVKFYQLFAKARTLKKLYLSDCIPDKYKFDIGLDKIVSSFPHLSVLELNYEHAREAFVPPGSSDELPVFANVTKLKLCTPRFHEQFTRWVANFLRQCPRLKRLYISGKVASGNRERVNENMAEFTSQMIQIMRSYPGVDLEFFFI